MEGQRRRTNAKPWADRDANVSVAVPITTGVFHNLSFMTINSPGLDHVGIKVVPLWIISRGLSSIIPSPLLLKPLVADGISY